MGVIAVRKALLVLLLVMLAVAGCHIFGLDEKELRDVRRTAGGISFSYQEIDFHVIYGQDIVVENRRGQTIKVQFFLDQSGEWIPKSGWGEIRPYATRTYVGVDFFPGQRMRIVVRGLYDFWVNLPR